MKVNKRVMMVLTRGDSIGGAQIHVRDLIDGLTEKGYELHLVLGSRGLMVDLVAKFDCTIHYLSNLKREISPLNDLVAISKLYRIISNVKPDLVHAHTAKAGVVSRIAALLKGVPCIFTVHGWQFSDGIKKMQRIILLTVEKALSRISKAYICVSEFDRQLALKNGLGSPKKFRTIHNGMKNLPLAPNRPPRVTKTIISVARFAAPKDHLTLFKALKLIEDLDWRLVLVGDGPDFDLAQESATRLGIIDRVDFLGHRSDVSDCLNDADIFVLSSLSEGFPNSILEAMRASLPVISTDVGGCNESVVEGQTGLLVPSQDPILMSKALTKLINNNELSTQMGRAGRLRFEEHFSFNHMIDQTIRVYDTFVG